MDYKIKYFNPKEYYYRVIVMCILMTVDIILNSFTQYMDFGSTNILYQYNIDRTKYDKDSGNIGYGLTT